MIYDKNGTSLNDVAYDIEGTLLNQAYDIDGNELFNDNTLTVMTYNVQWFSHINSNQTMQESIFDTYDADIIGLQELTKTSSTMPSLGETLFADYTYQAIGGQTNKTGIVSKIELSNTTTANFVRQASETRGYQKTYITVNGTPICWVNTHLETSGSESVKVAQAQEVFNLVQNEPCFIITGDFNTVCKSTSDTEYTTIMKQFVDAGYNCANCTEQHGFLDTWTDGSTASGTWYPCDHIITSSNIDINTVIVDTTKIDVASQTGQSIDHLPLIAYLTIN